VQPDEALGFERGVSLMSQVLTGVAPAARLTFPGQAQDGLQQSQYLVVVPLPDACAFTWRK